MKYEGQRPTCRLCDDESHFSNTCSEIRRNREAVVEKTVDSLSKTDETIPKEQPTNIPDKVTEIPTISLDADLKDSPSGRNDTIEIESETTQTTQTENERPIVASPEIPPEQIQPLRSSPTVIPETQFEQALPPVDTLDSLDPIPGTSESMDTDANPQTSHQSKNNSTEQKSWQTVMKHKKPVFKPILTSKNSRLSRPVASPQKRKQSTNRHDKS